MSGNAVVRRRRGDLCCRIERTAVDARTSRGLGIPVLTQVDVGAPKGIAAALLRSPVVHLAALLRTKEDAVLIPLLPQGRTLSPDLSRVDGSELIGRHLEERRERSDFVVAHPDVARSATAVSATRAAEAQTFVVPEMGRHDLR